MNKSSQRTIRASLSLGQAANIAAQRHTVADQPRDDAIIQAHHALQAVEAYLSLAKPLLGLMKSLLSLTKSLFGSIKPGLEAGIPACLILQQDFNRSPGVRWINLPV